MDVPAHIQHPPAIVNQVHVHGGRNIDLSRGTPATPVMPLPPPPPRKPAYAGPYRPGDNVPLRTPDIVVEYERGSANAAADTLKQLVADLKGRTAKAVVVAGHAEQDETAAAALAHRRAMEVASALRSAGLAEKHFSFAAERPAVDGNTSRRVEVFVIDQPRAAYELLD
jgi:hypothetical protein